MNFLLQGNELHLPLQTIYRFNPGAGEIESS